MTPSLTLFRVVSDVCKHRTTVHEHIERTTIVTCNGRRHGTGRTFRFVRFPFVEKQIQRDLLFFHFLLLRFKLESKVKTVKASLWWCDQLAQLPYDFSIATIRHHNCSSFLCFSLFAVAFLCCFS